MADFQLKVTAETQNAEKNLKRLGTTADSVAKERKLNIDVSEANKNLNDLGKLANETTRDRQIKVEIPNYSQLSKNFSDLNKDINNAANTVKQFYRISSQLPIGPVKSIDEMASQLRNVTTAASETKKNVGDAGDVIRGTLETAGRAAESLVGRLTKVAFSLYVINQASKAVQEAFGGMFNETIGKEIKLRETILKTQTTLASTNKVFRDGKEITDPYEKIVSLTGSVRKNIDSIRERSIALAGVTSNEVIEVFGIVAGQVGQIGGGLKEAEDLAINFAAALGTFGIPLYQARQEIGSILRGDITNDSILAKSLGISNEDIARAKTQVGGVVKFLEEKLAAAVAGQRIAAEGFAGVTSNIRDIQELVSQGFGRGLLDPLLDGLTKVFEYLFAIKDQLIGISELAGRAIGKVINIGIGKTTGASSVSKDTTGRSGEALARIGDGINKTAQMISRAMESIYLQLATVLERAQAAFGVIIAGFVNLAAGLLSLKLEQITAVVGAIEALSPALQAAANVFGGFLGLWGEFMKLPLVQELSQIAGGMRILEATGVIPLIRNGLILQGVLANWGKISQFVITQFNALRAMLGGLIAGFGGLLAGAAKTGAALLAAWAPQGKALQAFKNELQEVAQQLGLVGQAAQLAGSKVGSFESQANGAVKGVVGMIINMIKFNAMIFAISAAISFVIERYSAWKESQDQLASTKRAEEALRRLETTYKDVGEASSSATKRAKEFEQALVQAEYDKAFERLKALEKELKNIDDLLARRGKTTVFEDITNGTKALLENLGKVWGLMKLIAGAKPIRFEKPEQNKIFGFDVRNLTYEGRKEILSEKEKQARVDVNRWARSDDKNRMEENIKLEAEKRKNLVKEISDFQRQLDNDLFQQRQARAQKEVDIFRAAGELRIFQMEQANAKMIEGEEGASRTALAALNTYLSTRERGELEIEAAKKSLTVEITNLERTITDYRLDIEKKIFELRKRAGENDIKSAQLRRQQLAAAAKIVPGGAVRGGAIVYQRNDPDGEQTGSDIVLKGGVGAAIQNPFSSLSITKVGKQGFGSGPTGKGFGNYVTGEAILNGKKFEVLLGHLNETVVRVGDVLESGAVIGTQGITGRATGPHVSTHVNALNGGNPGAVLRSIENAWVKGGTIQSSAMGQAPKVEALQDASDIPDQSAAAERYAEAIRNVASAMERLRTIQEAVTNAKTAAAFDAIAKAVFEPVGLESYQDKMYELDGVVQSLAQGTYDAFNPERSQIAAEQAAKILSSQRELDQILAGIRKRTNLSEREKADLVSRTVKRHQEFVRSLKDEEQIRQRLNAIQQGVDLAKQFAQETAQIARENEVIAERTRLIAAGASPEIIERELEKLRTAQQYKVVNEELTRVLKTQLDLRDQLQQKIATAAPQEKTELQRQLDAALAEIKRLEALIASLKDNKEKRDKATDTKPPEMKERRDLKDVLKEWSEELESFDEEVAAFAETVQTELGTALADTFHALIDGTSSVREAFSNMFQNIYKTFVKMITDMLAKWALLSIFKAFGFSFGDGGVVGEKAAKGATFANGVAKFARGGAFTNSVVHKPTLFTFAKGGSISPGLMGEAGPEAIMPLRRGAGGRLGVDASGSGDKVSVVVNVDAKGTRVQGDDQQGNQLGRVIAAAVQQELIRQKRPGGLLT